MDPVPAGWRPLMCIEEPVVPSTDSLTAPTPTPAPVAPTPSHLLLRHHLAKVTWTAPHLAPTLGAISPLESENTRLASS
jgi:hypothetical protein